MTVLRAGVVIIGEWVSAVKCFLPSQFLCTLLRCIPRHRVGTRKKMQLLKTDSNVENRLIHPLLSALLHIAKADHGGGGGHHHNHGGGGGGGERRGGHGGGGGGFGGNGGIFSNGFQGQNSMSKELRVMKSKVFEVNEVAV